MIKTTVSAQYVNTIYAMHTSQNKKTCFNAPIHRMPMTRMTLHFLVWDPVPIKPSLATDTGWGKRGTSQKIYLHDQNKHQSNQYLSNKC